MIQLREQNSQLAVEVKRIKAQLRSSEESRLCLETEAKENQRKMLAAKQSFTRAMSEKEEAHKRVSSKKGIGHPWCPLLGADVKVFCFISTDVA